MKKTLVAYFSATGTTAKLAKKVASVVEGDLFEIRPSVTYTSADLNWNDKNSRSTIEMEDPSSRPEIAELPGDLSAYDTVFIGFPVWWYTAPHIIWNFVESVDLAGKKVIPFATSGSSPLGKTTSDLSALTGSDVEWIDGKVLNGASESQIKSWIEDLASKL